MSEDDISWEMRYVERVEEFYTEGLVWHLLPTYFWHADTECNLNGQESYG
jgi:hypothetical protein